MNLKCIMLGFLLCEYVCGELRERERDLERRLGVNDWAKVRAEDQWMAVICRG